MGSLPAEFLALRMFELQRAVISCNRSLCLLISNSAKVCPMKNDNAVELFPPLTLGSLQLPNRIVMAPMTRNRAEAGEIPGDISAVYYAQRATAGLIISEATQISQQGLGYPGTPGLHSSEQVAGWKKVTKGVHDA